MNDMSLKAKVKQVAKNKNVSAQSILQNYLMNRFLYRLSISKYKNKFVIKGGILISSLIGIENRTTMDIDTTLQNLTLSQDIIKKAIGDICSINTDDDIQFVLDSIQPIRVDDGYGGIRVSLYGIYGKIKAPMSIDISTGDRITPHAVMYSFADCVDEKTVFDLWAYPIETILAEKLETVLSRGIDNTRMRDFYDVYLLERMEYDKNTLKQAFIATASHRESINKISDYEEIINTILNDKEMNNRWIIYIDKMVFADSITFNEIISKVLKIMNEING